MRIIRINNSKQVKYHGHKFNDPINKITTQLELSFEQKLHTGNQYSFNLRLASNKVTRGASKMAAHFNSHPHS